MEGLVYKSTGNWCVVRDITIGTAYDRRIKGRLRLESVKNTDPIAVGDRVAFEVEEGTKGAITEVKLHDNCITRRPVNPSRRTHIIVSNIDLVFLVVTFNNSPISIIPMGRLLMMAEAYGIKTILLFNKINIYSAEEADEVKSPAQLYRQTGYECIGISATTSKNVDRVMTAMEGKTCVVSGHLGSSKSTLINAIDSELHLKVAAISGQHLQGQYTTTFVEMFNLPSGAHIIDTPGIRDFDMVEVEKKELIDYFPEFFVLRHHYRFHNRLHTDEPQCAIKETLEEGTTAWSRYKSYLQMLNGEGDR